MDDSFSIGQWKANATTQIVSASISFLASLLIVASTGKSFFSKNEPANTATFKKKKQKKKKTSPYRRIIFLISASDILYSLAFITGPFMTQKTNPQALWAVSESNTACVWNGTFFSLGASTSLLYYATLGYFYYCKISKRMTDEQFTTRYEKKIHILIVVICVAGTCLSIAAKTYNTSPTGTFCSNANTPAGCNQQPEIYGECDPKVEVYIPYFIYFSLLVSAYSILVMLYSMIRLVHSVLKKDKMFGEVPADPTQEQLHKYNLRKQLLKEMMSQAIMYTVSWFLCQSGAFAGTILHFNGVPNHSFPPAFQIYSAALLPLNSAVNVFIYTRPAVRHVRRIDPRISWLRAFSMVLQAGGEAPNMEQSSFSTQNQQQQPELSSREAFGRGEFYAYFYGSDPKDLDSLNVEILGSLEDISANNIAYRSEGKWSHISGSDDLSAIDEAKESRKQMNVQGVSNSITVKSGNKVLGDEFEESGLSFFSAMPMSNGSRGHIESGISLSDVDLFEDDK